ncbi:MAG TPA: hypothetical protein VIL08_03180 [Limnochorda sp.]
MAEQDLKKRLAELGLGPEYELESGLPDDFDFQIDRAEFGYDPEYKDAQGGNPLLLIWHGHSLTPGVEVSRPILWSTGTGWVSRDGGRTAVHERGKKNFVTTSVVGQLIRRCAFIPGAEEWAKVVNARKAKWTEARLWDGMRFHLKRETLAFGPSLEERERLMPTAFLGVVGQIEAPAPGPAPAAGSEQTAAGGGGAALKARLVKLAKECATFDEFQKKATDIQELYNDEALLTDVLDDSDKGFYARFHK